jgi:hypothetical protein
MVIVILENVSVLLVPLRSDMKFAGTLVDIENLGGGIGSDSQLEKRLQFSGYQEAVSRFICILYLKVKYIGEQ